jgi:peptidoglycan/xylan/chitin deacetylase (PgdA/CDA1 family)
VKKKGNPLSLEWHDAVFSSRQTAARLAVLPCRMDLAACTRHRLRLVALLCAVWCAAAAPALCVPAAAAAAAVPRLLAADVSVSAPVTGASLRSWASHTPVPILVYHHVQGYLAGNYLLYVGTSQFAGQLRYLRHHGYHPVTMQQVWDDWMGKADLPRRPVVLSFDDGYLDQYVNAARQLRRYHWPAVLNLVVYRGTALRDSQVRRMVKWGWEIGAHTLHHPILTLCSSAMLRRELVSSRRILHHKFDVPVDFFCYPGGRYDHRVMHAARDAGYLAATSIRYGAATPRQRYALPRIAVYWGESLSTFGSRMRQAVARAR